MVLSKPRELQAKLDVFGQLDSDLICFGNHRLNILLLLHDVLLLLSYAVLLLLVCLIALLLIL